MVIERFVIPARGHAGGEDRLGLGGEIKRVIVPGVMERLDAKPVARGKEGLVVRVPKGEGELAAQLRQAMHANLLVKVQRDFAVRVRPETVTAGFEFAADALEVVELAVDDDLQPFVFAGDGLITATQVNDAQPRVTEANALVGRTVDVLAGIRHHHERMDGEGYPDRLMGPQIPLLARIISVSDVFDALTQIRPYRRHQLTSLEAIEVIEAQTAGQLDPDLVCHFSQMIRSSVETVVEMESLK